MTSDLFYAILKLVSGEEILAKVCAFIENDEVLVVLDNPITVNFIVNHKSKVPMVKVNPWITLTSDTTHIIKRKDIITMTEVKDEQLVDIHERYVEEISTTSKNVFDSLTRSIGQVVNINDARKALEELYKSQESHSSFE
jgi:hypothetical protein